MKGTRIQAVSEKEIIEKLIENKKQNKMSTCCNLESIDSYSSLQEGHHFI